MEDCVPVFRCVGCHATSRRVVLLRTDRRESRPQLVAFHSKTDVAHCAAPETRVACKSQRGKLRRPASHETAVDGAATNATWRSAGPLLPATLARVLSRSRKRCGRDKQFPQQKPALLRPCVFFQVGVKA